MLHLHTSGTTQRIGANTLVQAATLGERVGDFLFDAFLHVARHDRPPRPTPDGESPPPMGSRIWVPPINLGRHLVGHPVPERDSTQGRTRYRDPNMAHPPPSATPDNTKELERETWVARMASLSNFRHHVPGDISTPDDRQPAPSTYMTLMYKLHYTLSTTHYHGPTDHLVAFCNHCPLLGPYRAADHWVVHGTDSLLPADYAPPPHNPGLDTYARGDEPDDLHIWGTWERKSLDTLLSICSGCQGLGRAMYCLAKWTQRTWGIPTDRWLWRVTPPANTPARLGADVATPRVTHVPAQPRQRHHTSTSTHGSPGKTRTHARCPNPHPRSRYLQDPASYARPRSPGPSAVSHSPLLRLQLHNLHHHDHLIHHHHRVLILHSTPRAAGDTSKTGPQTRPHREQPRRRQGPRPDEARTRDPAETQDRRHTATQTRQRATTATRSQAQTQAQTRRHDGSASPIPRGRPL